MFTSIPSSVLLAFTPADEDARTTTATVFTRLLNRISQTSTEA